MATSRERGRTAGLIAARATPARDPEARALGAPGPALADAPCGAPTAWNLRSRTERRWAYKQGSSASAKYGCPRSPRAALLSSEASHDTTSTPAARSERSPGRVNLDSSTRQAAVPSSRAGDAPIGGDRAAAAAARVAARTATASSGTDQVPRQVWLRLYMGNPSLRIRGPIRRQGDFDDVARSPER